MSRKRGRTPKGEWHHRTIVMHALRNWYKSVTPHAEQPLLPGMERPPTDARSAFGAKAFASILMAEAHPDGTLIFSRDFARDVYSISLDSYQKYLGYWRRLGVVEVVRKPSPGHPAMYRLCLPEWLRYFAPEGATGVLQPVPSDPNGGASTRPVASPTGGLEAANGRASNPPSKKYKSSAAARRASAGAALRHAPAPADDDAADAQGAASPPAGTTDRSRPRSKSNDAPTPVPPDASEVLRDDERTSLRYAGRPTTIHNPRRDVRARPPGWEEQQHQADEEARQAAADLLDACLHGTPTRLAPCPDCLAEPQIEDSKENLA